ncbi:hypothetical protein BPS10C_053 [Bacillus phage BPS10C]|uniref:Uncharacterized protein n=1 Tax=Bacillus phage BPS10C TaxID=1277886 RepID=W5QU87_9CAUD|nr:hypothetical protein BPS10C_053 [Bacillus phage BPS10C]AGI12050.1 hypothetical protein BPS10C_053 [Bacillus phage BPS10C]
MTRHTRNRQRIKAIHMETGIVTKYHMKDKNLPISRYRAALAGREIDPTFKWVRAERANFKYDEVNGIT